MNEAVQARATQSFVHTLSSTWRRPSLTALEVAWRWTVGVPALAAIVGWVRGALLQVTGGTLEPARLGLDRALVNDPIGALSGDTVGATAKVAFAVGQVLPALAVRGIWLVPVLVVVWVVASAVGRSAVLRRAEPGMRRRVGTLIGLQGIRIAVLVACFAVWFLAVERIGGVAVTGPLARHEEPDLVLYCALVIVLSLGMFTAWGFVSWWLAVAPLLAMLRDLGVGASLRAAAGLGALRAKLAEVNLVLAVVKIALIVLTMVFSATPLPFEAVTTPGFLAWWWFGVAVLYVLWSDFFHVARLVGYLALWRSDEDSARERAFETSAE